MDWHAAEISDVEQRLDTSRPGLTSAEAQRRLQIHGPNRLAKERGIPVAEILAHQLMNPIVYLLGSAAVVTWLLHLTTDTIMIVIAITVNVVIGGYEEIRAEQSLHSIAKLVAAKAHVLRSGQEIELDSLQVVPGDVVLLQSGAQVPADLRLISTTALMVDESILTGESLAVHKDHARVLPAKTGLADRVNLALAGTTVQRGRGVGYVYATGQHTEIGRLATEVAGTRKPASPLQISIGKLSRVLTISVLGFAALLVGLGLLHGRSLTEMFVAAAAMAVSAIPEGLPAAVSIALAVAVRRMARRNVIVRRLPAVETLGAATVIASDKTGTLTENRMTVMQVRTVSSTYSIPGSSSTQDDIALRECVYGATLANEATLYESEGKRVAQGDAVEVALLEMAPRLGHPCELIREENELVAELPFEPELRYSASIRRNGVRSTLYVKGAPERVLSACSTALQADGARIALPLASLEHDLREMTSAGLRVLAVAERDLAADGAHERALTDLESLTFSGLIGMADPPRAGVSESIAECQAAGVRVLMVTGDHVETAVSIARQIGLGGAAPQGMTGEAMAGLDEAALRVSVREVAVFARVTPQQKQRIVDALRANGEIVAITGDGVNDALALRAADVGIAMGKSGTDVARQSADIVLADDSFNSIVAGMKQGRTSFANIRNVTFFLVSTGIAEIIAIMTNVGLDLPLPFTAAQILWLNLVTNGFQDVALAFEPGDDSLRRRRTRAIIPRHLWRRVFLSAFTMAAGTLFVFFHALFQTQSLLYAHSAALTTMVAFQVVHVGNSRSDHRSVFATSPFSNRFLLLATLAALGVHLLALHQPTLGHWLRLTPLSTATWLVIVPVALTILLPVEIDKYFLRRRQPH